jgi:hypothetical protein
MFSKQEIISRRQQEAINNNGTMPPAGLNLAILILGSALYDQKQRSGKDYAQHPMVVGMTGTRSNTKNIIGVLHDVVEDSDWTLDDLKKCGFSERIVKGVDGVTKRPGELYLDFVKRCSFNPDSIDIKINDLEHNSLHTRDPNLLNDKGIKKTNLYKISYQYLVAIKKKKIQPGSKITDFINSEPLLKQNPNIQTLVTNNCSEGPFTLKNTNSLKP